MKDDSSNFTKYFTDPNQLENAKKKYDHYVSTGQLPKEESYNPPLAEPNESQQTESGLPPIINGNDFPPAYELTPRQFLVDGLFQRGDNVLITAPPKLGKSWFWANAAVAVSAGIPFLGRPTHKSNTLILDLELRRDVAMDRLIQISLARGLDQVPEGLWLWSLAKHCYDLDTICEVLKSRLMDLPDISLIVVDPLYIIDQGQSYDENNAHCVTRLMTALEQLTVETGATLGLSHHFRKGNLASQDAIDRGAGSGAFSRYPDVLMSLSKHEIEDCIIADCTTRNMKSPPSFVFQLQTPIFKIRPDLNASKFRRYGQPGIIEEAG